jgi:hypothetical protein
MVMATEATTHELKSVCAHDAESGCKVMPLPRGAQTPPPALHVRAGRRNRSHELTMNCVFNMLVEQCSLESRKTMAHDYMVPTRLQ